MPGIVGLVTRQPPQQAHRQLHCMLETLRHEPFYETGTWVDESLGVYVGWCARSSCSAQMPLRNARGDVVLLFSGEEFSEANRVRAPEQGAAGREIEDSHYLAQLYENAPSSFPAQLNGRFHGLVVDRTRRMATLFNDRYGLHRLYYHEGHDAVYFAAEAKAILAVCPALRTIDPRALSELIICGCVLENRTLFAGIGVLPGAARWLLRDGAVETKAVYFQPQEWEDQTPLAPDSYYAALRETFARILPRYFAGHERIGMSLTGGLDTRLIMAQLRPPPQSLPCYTFGGMLRECQDVRIARQVAQACGQSHQTIPVGEQFLARFPHYAERAVYITDGCVEVNRAADLYLNEIARQIAPVRMTGNSGSEVLRAVRAFKPVAPPPGLFSADLSAYLRDAEATYASLLRCHPLSFAVFRQAPWHHYGLLALEQSQVAVRSPYLDNDLVRTVFRAAPAGSTDSGVTLQLIADAHAGLRQIRTDRGLGGAGLFSLMTRALRELQFKGDYVVGSHMPQWLMPIDRVLAPLPERLFLGTHKFAHFRVWYRDALAGHLRDVLLDPRTLSLPYLERRGVEAVVNDHLDGRRNYALAIHKLLTIELIQRLFTAGT